MLFYKVFRPTLITTPDRGRSRSPDLSQLPVLEPIYQTPEIDDGYKHRVVTRSVAVQTEFPPEYRIQMIPDGRATLVPIDHQIMKKEAVEDDEVEWDLRVKLARAENELKKQHPSIKRLAKNPARKRLRLRNIIHPKGKRANPTQRSFTYFSPTNIQCS